MVGERILVVEDDAIIAFNLQRVLLGFGYQVLEIAVSGAGAAVDAAADAGASAGAERLRPDLALVDLQLGGAPDGLETARQIRERWAVPVIYLTARADDPRLGEAGQPPYGSLVKPVQEGALRAAVEMALVRRHLDLRLQESETAYRELYHNTPAMLLTIDPQGQILQISDYCLRVIGYTRAEVIGRSPLDFITPEDREVILDQIAPALAQPRAVRDAECRLLCKDGRALDVYFSVTGIFDAQGNLAQVLAALVDITARKRAEAAERDQRALAEALRDTAAALSSTLRLDEVLERVLTNVGRVVPHDAVNIMLVEQGMARIERSHGFRECGIQAAEPDGPVSLNALPYLSLMAGNLQPVTVPDTRRLPRWQMDGIRSYAGAPIVGRGRLLGFINLFGLASDFFQPEHASRLLAFANQSAIAIENAHLYAEVQRLATVDELTGVANRRRLFELGQKEFDKARRLGLPLAAILLDIDRFKKINDTYGHTTGDRVLSGIAQAISGHIRDIDLFGRYGGEEFVALLLLTERAAALEVAGRLLTLVSGLRFTCDGVPFSVTISLGVAMLTEDTSSLANLIDRADQAMYAAKQAGRCRVEIDAELTGEAAYD